MRRCWPREPQFPGAAVGRPGAACTSLYRAHAPRYLAAASLIASAFTVAAIQTLRHCPDALIRVSSSPTWLEHVHVLFASAALPLSFALLGSAWLLVCGWLAGRLLPQGTRSILQGRLRRIAFAWIAVGVPAYAIALAVMAKTSAFKANTAFRLALVVLGLAPLVPSLLRGLSWLLARAIGKVKRRAPMLLAALSIAALTGLALATEPLALRYGLSQLLGFGLTTIALVLAWAELMPRLDPNARSARLSLGALATCCALSVSALFSQPSRTALEHFHLARPASWFARALHRLPPDGDRDGYSARLGFLDGGDCDDSDPKRSPGAPELLDNGVDDNCFGSDATRSLAQLRTHAPVPHAPARTATTPSLAPASVVMVVLDSLRFDRGFADGIDPKVTPAIARIASGARRYASFRTCAPRTHESVADLLGSSFDVAELDGQQAALQSAPRGAIADLSRRGVHTAFIASDWLARYAEVSGWKERHHTPARYGHFADEQVLDDALGFLHAAPKSPFLLYVHFLGAHEPYAGDPECSATAETEAARYHCALLSLDRKVGALHAALAQLDPQRTLFVMTADHGEELGEHGGRYHATTLYDEMLHVPLLVAGANVQPALVEQPASCFDLLPTVLGLAELADDATPAACNASACAQVARTRGAHEASPFEPEASVVVLQGHKLLFDRRTGLSSYFDLAADPLEHHPLARAPADLEPRLLAHMDAWLSSQTIARARPRPSTPEVALAHLE